MGTQRSGKFYRKNEADVMQQLGLEPTPNSGSGWIVKEDGQNENIICQLKSTDANRITVVKQDLDKLEYNANVTHKLPVFAIQFIKSNDTYLMVRPEDLVNVAQYLKTGEAPNIDFGVEITEHEMKPKKKKAIKSSSNARTEFLKDNDKQYKKKVRSAI